MNQAKIQAILHALPKDVTLITVTKQHTKQEIDEAYRCGCRIFGENKVQELCEKYDPRYEWHMIGHLQRNKVKAVVDRVSMIQSLDSYALALEIEKQCAKRDRIMPVLIEVNIAKEERKSGIAAEALMDFVKQCDKLSHVDVQGLMCIGAHVADREVIAANFAQMHTYFLQLQKIYGTEKIRYLSMGMSDDYEIALAHGSNMIRLGSILMGNRS
ncbi:MAG: YggS family pyridoxal phosphate-dependent enzyme [Erysipelotrichaceae bacterium]|nr:YggS family pyridoxal phosphate-dependent enzyme [Erysipelotrichaceae bacterium]